MGLIDQKMQADQGQQATVDPSAIDGNAETGDDAPLLNADNVRKGMKLPPGSEKAYEKIIKAGLKVMFDPSMRDETMGFIENSEGDPAKMAEGVTAVIVSLYQQSNGTMPPNLLIPAGIELLVHATDVANAGGMDVPKDAIAAAMSELVKQILTKFGATPEQMQKLMSGMDSGQKAPEMASGQAQPADPAAQAMPQQGV